MNDSLSPIVGLDPGDRFHLAGLADKPVYVVSVMSITWFRRTLVRMRVSQIPPYDGISIWKTWVRWQPGHRPVTVLSRSGWTRDSK